MSIKCQWCKRILSSKYALEKHQTTAQFCLAIQEKPVKKEHICEYCDKSFTRKDKLYSHVFICTAKDTHDLVSDLQHQLAQKDELLTKAKLRIKTMKTDHKSEIKTLQTRISELEKDDSRKLGKIDVYETIKPGKTTINNTIISVNEKLASIPIGSIQPLTLSLIKEIIKGGEYTYETFCKGTSGLVKFIMGIITKESESDDAAIPERNYACTNQKERKFHRLQTSKKWKLDGGAKWLHRILDQLSPSILQYQDKLIEDTIEAEKDELTRGNFDRARTITKDIVRGITNNEGTKARDDLHVLLSNKLAAKTAV